jgi:hypothetical protein
LKSLQILLALGFDERDGLYYNARQTVKPPQFSELSRRQRRFEGMR